MLQHETKAGPVPVDEVVLHCAAIKTGQFRGLTAFDVFSIINQWHRERGFKNGFGYHALIMPDGIVYPGRPLFRQGAHVIGHNAGTLGLLLIESTRITTVSVFEDWFTSQQRTSARAWIGGVGGIKRVSGHNDYARKLCPGFKVRCEDWL